MCLGCTKEVSGRFSSACIVSSKCQDTCRKKTEKNKGKQLLTKKQTQKHEEYDIWNKREGNDKDILELDTTKKHMSRKRKNMKRGLEQI